MTGEASGAGFRRWLERHGGMLVAPRQTVATLGEHDGRRDGTWALLGWLLAVHVYDLFQVVARISALRSLDAFIGGAAEIAFAVLPPFVATFVVELTLGRERAYRAGTCLAPMIVIGAVLRLSESLGLWLASPSWLPDVMAGTAALALAFYVRPAVPALHREAR